MSKHENILNFDAAAVVPAPSLDSIDAAFRAWSKAFEATDNPKANPAAVEQARDTMKRMWEEANSMQPQTPADVAAMYVMAERTVTADPDTFMERAWGLIHAQGGDNELIKLYGVWRKLTAVYDAGNYDGDTDKELYQTIGDLESQMAAIPAVTAQGLAIKVDLGRWDKEGNLANGLNADLARLTGYDTRPDAY